MTLSRQNILAAGLGAAFLTTVALAAANFLGDGENGGSGPYVVTLAFALLVGAVLFGWAIPRIERPARMGLIVGAIGVLSIAAFWTGLPFVLGPAAIVLGLLSRAGAEGKAGMVAALLGVLATVGGIAAVIADQAL